MVFRPSNLSFRASLGAALVLLGAACAPRPAPNSAEAPPPAAAEARPRNVIVLIGDGMGPQQLGFLLAYARLVEARPTAFEALMEKGESGLTTTAAYETLVTDSAAAATALASGVKTRNGMVGVGPDGRPVRTILERAKAAGKATGVVSTTRITDATPGAYVAHVPSRGMENEVAQQIVRETLPEVALGGGLRHFIPRGRPASDYLPPGAPAAQTPSERKDDADLLREARARGYQVVTSRRELEAAGGAGPLLGLFAASTIPYEIDQGPDRTAPTLVEMTEAALARLSRSANGFFLMVEGARIDHAGHDNDAGAMLGETRAFDAALAAALRFAEARGDTLVLVTADHETGGGGFSYRRVEASPPIALPTGETYVSKYDFGSVDALRALGRQRASFERIVAEAGADPERLRKLVAEAVGYELSAAEAAAVVAREPATADFRDFTRGDGEAGPVRRILLGRALAPRTNIVWSTGGHTATPVVTAAYGPGMAAFRGVYENTEVARRLEALFP